MYVFFEHHKDSDGTVVATDVICSSYPNSTQINWRTDKVQFDVMRGLLKTPPLNQRNYDDKIKMWTYLGTSGFNMLQVLEDTFRKLPNARIEFREVDGLETAATDGVIPENKQKKIDPKNFFYNKAPVTQEISKPDAIKYLSKVFGVQLENVVLEAEVKKLYRAAAIQLHPDRNGGDGKKMSELNMYWQIYKGE